MLFKRTGILIVSLIISISLAFSTYANDAEIESALTFSDVSPEDPAYSSICTVVERNIMGGYPNNSFKPEGIVTRGEFASMLVNALELDTSKTETQSYKDVGKEHWAFKAVENAKYYLTGFRSSRGDYFKPDSPILREDMAVALVKALGYAGETADDGVLKACSDYSSISIKLRKYAAIAVKYNILEIERDGDRKLFKPKSSMKRSDMAVLLCKLIEDEKITYEDEEEKVVYDAEPQKEIKPVIKDYAEPEVTGRVENSAIVLSWKKINDDRLQGYKVVISKKSSSPKYPENGYLTWITDKNRTSMVINNNEPYKNGDFGEYLKPGESYYFSVTAYYNDRKVAGNAVLLKYPGETGEAASEVQSGDKVTSLTGKAVDGAVLLRWQPVTKKQGFSYYKVVISKYNPRPVYPDDGYLHCITDINETEIYVTDSQGYNNGDFGGYLEPGETYYFSITAVYGGKRNAGNVIKIEYP